MSVELRKQNFEDIQLGIHFFSSLLILSRDFFSIIVILNSSIIGHS